MFPRTTLSHPPAWCGGSSTHSGDRQSPGVGPRLRDGCPGRTSVREMRAQLADSGEPLARAHVTSDSACSSSRARVQLACLFLASLFRFDRPGHCAWSGGSEVADAGHAELGGKGPEMAGTWQETRPCALRHGRAVDRAASLMEILPTNLATLDHEQLRRARRTRDERMSILFRGWPSLSTIELRELRTLSDERQRIARHIGIHRRLRALAPHETSPGEARRAR